jgi:hypothetical protein
LTFYHPMVRGCRCTCSLVTDNCPTFCFRRFKCDHKLLCKLQRLPQITSNTSKIATNYFENFKAAKKLLAMACNRCLSLQGNNPQGLKGNHPQGLKGNRPLSLKGNRCLSLRSNRLLSLKGNDRPLLDFAACHNSVVDVPAICKCSFGRVHLAEDDVVSSGGEWGH